MTPSFSYVIFAWTPLPSMIILIIHIFTFCVHTAYIYHSYSRLRKTVFVGHRSESPCHNHVITMSQPCHNFVTTMSVRRHNHFTTMSQPC